jgi:uncharacterized delta-60 repeat protein
VEIVPAAIARQKLDEHESNVVFGARRILNMTKAPCAWPVGIVVLAVIAVVGCIAIDTNFGTSGYVMPSIVNYAGNPVIGDTAAVLVQSDGKIVLGATVGPTSAYQTQHDFAFLRFDGNGQPDTSFGTAGKAIVNLWGFPCAGGATACGSDDYMYAMVQQPDGKIFATGSSLHNYGGYSSYIGYARLNTDGTPDTTLFGTGHGYDYLDDLYYNMISAQSVAIQGDNKILVGGSWEHNQSPITLGGFITRLSPEGNRDLSFGTNGVVIETEMRGTIHMALQTDGKILLVGFALAGSGYKEVVTRYNADGSRDASFGVGGKAQFNYSYQGYTSNVLAQPDGKVIVVGEAYGKVYVSRLNGDGSPDTTYGTNGVGYSAETYGRPFNAVLAPGGRVLVVGYLYNGANAGQGAVWRFNAAGGIDDYDQGSMVYATDLIDWVKAVALQPTAGAPNFILGFTRPNQSQRLGLTRLLAAPQ